MEKEKPGVVRCGIAGSVTLQYATFLLLANSSGHMTNDVRPHPSQPKNRIRPSA